MVLDKRVVGLALVSPILRLPYEILRGYLMLSRLLKIVHPQTAKQPRVVRSGKGAARRSRARTLPDLTAFVGSDLIILVNESRQ